MSEVPQFWIGVACRSHVNVGVAGGFCQLGHGKLAPVKRLKRGDGLIYYSPRETLEGNEKVQGFTAIGQVVDDEPYQVEQKPGFCPMRRNVHYLDAQYASIKELLPKLNFIAGHGRSWGMLFRRSSFKVGPDDFCRIAEAMSASLENLPIAVTPEFPAFH
ncbi:MAG: EVE domain-containing protein [Paracoccaceae bacterium]